MECDRSWGSYYVSFYVSAYQYFIDNNLILKWNFAFIQNVLILFNSSFVYIYLHFRTCHLYTVAGKMIIVYAYQIVMFTTLQHVQLVTMVYIVHHVDTVEGVKGVILWLVTVVKDVNLIGRCPSVKVGKEQGSHYNPTMKIMQVVFLFHPS